MVSLVSIPKKLLKKFQNNRNLKIDGIVGKKTWSYLIKGIKVIKNSYTEFYIKTNNIMATKLLIICIKIGTQIVFLFS